jgi:hypothetical protein
VVALAVLVEFHGIEGLGIRQTDILQVANKTHECDGFDKIDNNRISLKFIFF